MTITYRTVQGTIQTGTVLETHRQTGELLIVNGRSRAWVHPDRTIPQETNQ